MSKHSYYPAKVKSSDINKGLFEIMAELDESEENFHSASIHYLNAAKFKAATGAPMWEIEAMRLKSQAMMEKAYQFDFESNVYGEY
jgi:hypothetical protein